MRAGSEGTPIAAHPNFIPLRFGEHRTLLRALEPGDRDRMLEFFASHTPDTIHARYGYLLSAMSPERAARLVGVDQSRDVALGVFELREGRLRLIAVGRYCLTDDGQAGELAFVVREDRRRLGIATTLLRFLVTIATDRGLRELNAQVQHDNRPMLATFRRVGATFTPRADGNGVQVRLTLTPGQPYPCHL